MEQSKPATTPGQMRRTLGWLGHTLRRLSLSMVFSILLHVVMACVVVLILTYEGPPMPGDAPAISVSLASPDESPDNWPQPAADENRPEEKPKAASGSLAENLQTRVKQEAEQKFQNISETITSQADQLFEKELSENISKQKNKLKTERSNREEQISDIVQASKEEGTKTAEKAVELKESLAGTFYGLAPGDANRIVYVVDHSSSMTSVFPSVQTELKRAVESLTEKKQFHIIFFSDDPISEMPAKQLVQATAMHKRQAIEFIDGIAIGSGTQPRPALAKAFETHPDLIYFLTDGQFDADVANYVLQLNNDKRIAVNTIGFGDPTGQAILRLIAEQNGGKFRAVK